MGTINDLSGNDTPQLNDQIPSYSTSNGVTRKVSINNLLGAAASLPTVQPVAGSGALWIDPLDDNAIKVALTGGSSNKPDLTEIVTDLAFGTATNAGTLTGTETVPMSRGQGLLQTTLTTLAQWVLQTYKGFTQAGSGAVARTAQDKARDFVSVKDFGAKGDGVTDDTIAIQAAMNSGATGWHVPAGSYVFTILTIPQVLGFSFFGVGTASQLIQKGGGIKFPTMPVNCFDSHGSIRDLYFDGTAGTGNTLDTTFCQTVDILNVYFNNVPVGMTSLKLDGNPTAPGTYAHDVRVKNIRIYSTTAGNAGIALGSWHSDSTIDGFIMNGGFTTNYCLLALSGAQTTVMSNSHPYNAKINVVSLQGNNGNFGWDACIFDNALQDTFYSLSAINGRFSNCWFQSTNVGKRALVFDNSFNNLLIGTYFESPFGVAAACAVEVNGSSGNKIQSGIIDNSAHWTTLFTLSGSGSYAKGFQGYGSFDTIYNLVGVAQTAQGQNTSTNLGTNGANVGLGFTAFPVPISGLVRSATISVDATPAAGQTFTFNLQKNSATIGSATVSNGSFQATISLSPFVSVGVGDQLSIQSVFSTTSGSATPRYVIQLMG